MAKTAEQEQSDTELRKRVAILVGHYLEFCAHQTGTTVRLQVESHMITNRLGDIPKPAFDMFKKMATRARSHSVYGDRFYMPVTISACEHLEQKMLYDKKFQAFMAAKPMPLETIAQEFYTCTVRMDALSNMVTTPEARAKVKDLLRALNERAQQQGR